MAKVLMIKVAEEVKKKIQTDMLSSFIKSDTELIENKHSGKYISNLNFDVNQITGMLSNSFLNFVMMAFVGMAAASERAQIVLPSI